MLTAKAPTLAASVNRLIVANQKLSGDLPSVDVRRPARRRWEAAALAAANAWCAACVPPPPNHSAVSDEPAKPPPQSRTASDFRNETSSPEPAAADRDL